MHRIKQLVPQGIKNIYHLLQAVLANIVYGFPSGKLKVIGVTGTNGKTTTVQMIAKILEEAGNKVAVASTINFKIGDKKWVNDTKFTTLSSFAVQKFIKKTVRAGCKYLVLETSSHSLDQYRVWGVKYKIAVITNVTREHLDYHKTMEEYAKSKEKLFKMVSRNNGTIVVNLDMENPENYLKYSVSNKFGYTAKNQNAKNYDSKLKIIKAENIILGMNNSSYQIQNIGYRLQLPGEFNIENALAATCAGVSEGITLETISKALEKIKNIPGRFEFVQNDKGFNIVIDYAVTPDSLEKLYELIGKIKKAESSTKDSSVGKIIAVFGACGERDRGKRPIMGNIVSNHADYVIVTNEDPYGEDPAQIMEEIVAGIKSKRENENFWKILNRRESIKKALKLAKPGDFIVITGKGAEETMAIGKKRVPWNDRKIVEEELQRI